MITMCIRTVAYDWHPCRMGMFRTILNEAVEPRAYHLQLEPRVQKRKIGKLVLKIILFHMAFNMVYFLYRNKE